MEKNYKQTMTACYLAFVTQAIAANFAPLLFIKFHSDYNISFGKIALISAVLFTAQIVIDMFCAKFVDKIGYRQCAVAAEIFSSIGLAGLAFLPELLPDPFAGIIVCVIVYAVGSGLIEVISSPIAEACPFENKDKVMSLLHSFYCWGTVGVIAVSTLFFAVFGIDNWKLLACIWAVIPLINAYNYAKCPIEKLVKEGEGLKIKSLLKIPIFWISIILMICAGASELAMAQWASAFSESALGLSKTAGDLAAPCMFAVTMGISRAIYGKYGGKLKLTKFMMFSGFLCLLCYIAASLSNNSFVGLAGCIICGFSVGIMWPGTISVCSKNIPAGGTAMFALLAMAGDIGGALGPAMVGGAAQAANDNIQAGLLLGCLFPLVLIISLLILQKSKK